MKNTVTTFVIPKPKNGILKGYGDYKAIPLRRKTDREYVREPFVVTKKEKTK